MSWASLIIYVGNVSSILMVTTAYRAVRKHRGVANLDVVKGDLGHRGWSRERLLSPSYSGARVL